MVRALNAFPASRATTGWSLGSVKWEDLSSDIVKVEDEQNELLKKSERTERAARQSFYFFLGLRDKTS